MVEAQRRAQDILDVPVAVNSYSAEALEAAQIDDIIDFNYANPSLFSTGTLTDPLNTTPVRIRGFGTGGGNPSFESAVGMYVNDVYRSRAGAAVFASFHDLESIEVLRGPQGTLFGKNTTAGAISIRSARPDFDGFSGRLIGEAGNYGSYRAEGMLNMPLGEAAAFRVSALFDTTDGFFTNAVTGEDTFWQDQFAIRGTLAFEPTDRLAMTLIVEYSDYDTPGNGGYSTRLDNLDETAIPGIFPGLNNTLYPAIAFNTADGGLGGWYYDVSDPFNPGPADPFSYTSLASFLGSNSLEQLSGTLKIDVELSDSVQLRSITSALKIDNPYLDNDADFGPESFNNSFNQVYDFETISQEFLLDGGFETGGGMNIDWVLGAHYFNEDIDYRNFSDFGDQLDTFGFLLFTDPMDPNPLPPFVYATDGWTFRDSSLGQHEESFGIFGHASIDLTEQISIIGGVRWNSIEKSGFNVNNLGTRDEYHDAAALNGLVLYAIGGVALTGADFTAETSDQEINYDVALQLRPTDDIQLYAKYAHGFKAGGVNLNMDAAAGGPNGLAPPDANGRRFSPIDLTGTTFAPEFVDAYEIGMRWAYPGGLFSVTGFWSDFDDLQVATFNGIVFSTENAGTSRTRGVELENSWQVTDNLSTTVGLTWLEDASYGDDVPDLPAGRRRAYAPELAFSLGAQYEQPLTETVSGYLNANYSYVGDHFTAEGSGGDDRNSTIMQEAYGIASFALGVRSDELGADVSVWCNNCFDKNYITWSFDHVFHEGDVLLINPGNPRTWGVRAKKDF